MEWLRTKIYCEDASLHSDVFQRLMVLCQKAEQLTPAVVIHLQGERMAMGDLAAILDEFRELLRKFVSEAVQFTALPPDLESFREKAIQKRAYRLWIRRGAPKGDPWEDWHRAVKLTTPADVVEAFVDHHRGGGIKADPMVLSINRGSIELAVNLGVYALLTIVACPELALLANYSIIKDITQQALERFKALTSEQSHSRELETLEKLAGGFSQVSLQYEHNGEKISFKLQGKR